MPTSFYINFYRAICICSLSLSPVFIGLNATDFDSNEFSDRVLVCDNANDQVDNFIEVCIEYQKQTGKKFDYKKFLRRTYEYLEDQNVYIPKDIKKEVENSVKERLAELLSENTCLEKAFQNQTLNRYRRERPNTNNDVRNSVLRAGTGVLMMCVPCPAVQYAGGYVALREVDYLYDYTKSVLQKCLMVIQEIQTKEETLKDFLKEEKRGQIKFFLGDKLQLGEAFSASAEINLSPQQSECVDSAFSKICWDKLIRAAIEGNENVIRRLRRLINHFNEAVLINRSIFSYL